MSRIRPARALGAVTAVALWAVAGPAQAGEAGTPPARPDAAGIATPDTIESARHELRQLKIGREALPSNPGLPRVSAPAWQEAAGPKLPAVTPRPGAATEGRNPNWLVDAMRKSAESPADDRGRSVRGNTSAPGPIRAPNTPERSEVSGGMAAGNRQNREPNPPGVRPVAPSTAINPLASFLDDWMSPQDFALLQPGLAAGRINPISAPTAAPDFGLVALDGRAGSAGQGNALQPSRRPASGRSGTLRENPFLQSIGPLVTPISAIVPPPRAATSASAPAAIQASAAAPFLPSTPARIPEFARPTSDEKYFKPLKRF